MTPEKKRIAIAEACGWRGISEQFLVGYAPWRTEPYSDRVNACSIADIDCIPLDPLPDYFNDLNAMHDAEKMLTTPEQRYNFISILYDIVNNFIPDEVDDYVPDYWEVSSVQVFPHLHATAAQRAEAFGKTLNLW